MEAVNGIGTHRARKAAALGHFRDFRPSCVVFDRDLAAAAEDAARLAEIAFAEEKFRQPDLGSFADLVSLWQMYRAELLLAQTRSSGHPAVQLGRLAEFAGMRLALVGDDSDARIGQALEAMLASLNRLRDQAQEICNFLVSRGRGSRGGLENRGFFPDFRLALRGLEAESRSPGLSARAVAGFRMPLDAARRRAGALLANADSLHPRAEMPAAPVMGLAMIRRWRTPRLLMAPAGQAGRPAARAELPSAVGLARFARTDRASIGAHGRPEHFEAAAWVRRALDDIDAMAPRLCEAVQADILLRRSGSNAPPVRTCGGCPPKQANDDEMLALWLVFLGSLPLESRPRDISVMWNEFLGARGFSLPPGTGSR